MSILGLNEQYSKHYSNGREKNISFFKRKKSPADPDSVLLSASANGFNENSSIISWLKYINTVAIINSVEKIALIMG